MKFFERIFNITYLSKKVLAMTFLVSLAYSTHGSASPGDSSSNASNMCSNEGEMCWNKPCCDGLACKGGEWTRTCYPSQPKHSYIEHYTTPENKPLNLPFSEAVRVGNTVYLSGQIGVPPGGNEVVPGGIEAESKQTLTNIGLVLKHFGLTFENIVKCQVMLVDIAEWPTFNTVYKQFMKAPYPARSAFAGSGLALNARVEVECIAVIPEKVNFVRE